MFNGRIYISVRFPDRPSVKDHLLQRTDTDKKIAGTNWMILQMTRHILTDGSLTSHPVNSGLIHQKVEGWQGRDIDYHIPREKVSANGWL